MAPDGSAIPEDGHVEFDVILPTTDDALKANVKHSRSLGLPEVDDRVSHLNIVANGPSARGVRFKGQSMALNGALSLFTENAPDFWCASDPQELVADFLDPTKPGGVEPPESTIYLVASKCHPAVFERLKGRKVYVWHIDDVDAEDNPGVRLIPCAPSITLTAMILAQRMGARSLDVWGWDCAFADDGAHHAGTGEMGSTASTVTVRVGTGDWGKEFKTTPTWAFEAQDAIHVLPLLKWAGVDVKIHGPGMVRAIAQEYADKPLLAPFKSEELKTCLVG